MLPGKVAGHAERAGVEHARLPGAVPGEPRPRLAPQPALVGVAAAQLRPAERPGLRRLRGHLLRERRRPSTAAATCPPLVGQPLRRASSAAAGSCSGSRAAPSASPSATRTVVNRYSRFDLYPAPVAPDVGLLPPGHPAGAGPGHPLRRHQHRGRLHRRLRSTGGTWRPRWTCAGPTFSRVFENKGGFYSDRFKHVIGPEVTWTYRSKVEEFDFIPKFDYLDQILGTNQVNYALVQRLLRQAPRRLGQAGGLRVPELARGADLLRGHRRGAERVRPQLLLRGLRPRRRARALLAAAVEAAPAARRRGLQSNFDLEYDVNFKHDAQPRPLHERELRPRLAAAGLVPRQARGGRPRGPGRAARHRARRGALPGAAAAS